MMLLYMLLYVIICYYMLLYNVCICYYSYDLAMINMNLMMCFITMELDE